MDIPSHGVRLSAWHFPATSSVWERASGRPCVVMAHGFGAAKDGGLEAFAKRFQAAGSDVVAFDYRGFGTSDGTPRQDVNHVRHRADYRAVIAHVRGMPGIDPDRIVVWGSSYSGGHVIAVAAKDQRLAGVISQGAAMDGLAAVFQILSYAGPVQLGRLTGHALLGLVKRNHKVPIVGPPGSLAAISSEDGEAGYGLIMGPSFRNEMYARGILRIMLNRPVSSAAKVTSPTLLVVAEQDSIAPVKAVDKVASKLSGRTEQLRMDVGHFEIYQDAPFERSITRQLEFLASAVG